MQSTRVSLLVCTLLAFASRGEVVEVRVGVGISMHGDLKYGAGFEHFDYVKPDAILRSKIRNEVDNLLVSCAKGCPMLRPVETRAQVFDVFSSNRARLRELRVERLGLFGSFVRGDQTTGSDVDVLVEFEEGEKSFDRFMELAFLLEDRLQRRVELLTPAALCSHLRQQILDEVEYETVAT